MRKIAVLAFLLSALSAPVLAQPCEMFFQSENLCLEQVWEVHPTRSTPGKMLLTFKDLQGRIISPVNDPFVMLWMSSMGHGSLPVTITQIEDGIYSVTNVKFIMGGPWEIHYQLKDGKTVVEEIIRKISI